jgi:hypothetical protein
MSRFWAANESSSEESSSDESSVSSSSSEDNNRKVANAGNRWLEFSDDSGKSNITGYDSRQTFELFSPFFDFYFFIQFLLEVTCRFLFEIKISSRLSLIFLSFG